MGACDGPHEGTADEHRKVLVLGVGNTLLQDEGLGVHAALRLQDAYVLPPDVTVLDGGTLGLDLLSYLDGVTHLLILDALTPDGQDEGVVRLEGQQIPAGLALKLSVHQVALQDLLAAAALLGNLPPAAVALGLCPKAMEWGCELTSEVAQRLPELVEAAAAQLADWGCATSPKAAPAQQPQLCLVSVVS